MPTKTKLEADINDLIRYIDDNYIKSNDGVVADFTNEQVELILDALVFYKEMNTY